MRLALGATAGGLVVMMLQYLSRLAGIGLFIGMGVALLASYLPARGIGLVHPSGALRAE